jgi:uncharacterized protein (DUF305 family)
MSTTPVIAAIVALLVGLGGGYVLAENTQAPANATGTHIMPDGSNMSNAMANMTAGLEGKTGDEFDRAFIEGMIVHHEGAVAMAQRALEIAKHSEIRLMANEIISAQTREIETMRGWLRDWYTGQR